MSPRLLDLFCGAGGCSVGYHRAGFDVVGVDIEPQPNYPFEVYRDDALDFLERLYDDPSWIAPFDAIHASPPCQHYAPVTRWRGRHDDHPDLVDQVRRRLERQGLPWVMENVPGAPMRPDFVLCGSQFSLPVRRHRWFEVSFGALGMVPPCQHAADDLAFDHGGKQQESVYRDAMGVGWMTVRESRNAIPPAYTEYLGGHLLAHLESEAA